MSREPFETVSQSSQHLDLRKIDHRVGKNEVPWSDGPQPESRIAGDPPGVREPALDPAVRYRAFVTDQQSADRPCLESGRLQQRHDSVG